MHLSKRSLEQLNFGYIRIGSDEACIPMETNTSDCIFPYILKIFFWHQLIVILKSLYVLFSIADEVYCSILC